jgi:hypothetical protein
VGSRTLARLDAALTAAERDGPDPADTLVRIAIAYCDFAADNLELWRALFAHRMAPGKSLPDWAISAQMDLFRHIYHPLVALFPRRSPEQLAITARSLFSAVHGMVALGLEHKLIAVPIDALRSEVATIVRAIVEGLTAQPRSPQRAQRNPGPAPTPDCAPPDLGHELATGVPGSQALPRRRLVQCCRRQSARTASRGSQASVSLL